MALLLGGNRDQAWRRVTRQSLRCRNRRGAGAGDNGRIDLIGDSTQTDNAGYGRGFCANLTAQVDCVNMAKGGASTKTFASRVCGSESPDQARLHADSVRA